MKNPILTCHGCAHEWAEACDFENEHLPSNDTECKSCKRNVRVKFFTSDNYITPSEFVDRTMMKIKDYRRNVDE